MAQEISVTLPSAVIYVTGSINGVTVAFSLTGTNTWTATCDRTDDDIYAVSIEACDAAGNVTYYNITLYYGLQLITDRTGGYYTAGDLNRVGSAMKYIGDRLSEYGYSADISPKLDFAMQDVRNAALMTRYISDLNALKNAFTVYSTTPEPPENMNWLTYIEANNIEKILQDIDALITCMSAAFLYSAEIYSGEA